MRVTYSMLAATVVMAGCAAPPAQRAAPLPAFDAELHAPYSATGSASISGQAMRRQRGGGVVTCAGGRVLLAPATPYMRAVVQRALSGELAGSERLPASAGAVVRSTRCDAQGRFRFDGLAPLRWIVATDVTWYSGRDRQGGPVIGEADASPNAAPVVLTGD